MSVMVPRMFCVNDCPKVSDASDEIKRKTQSVKLNDIILFSEVLTLLLILIFSMANWFVRSKMRALAGNSLGKLMRCRKRGMRRRDSLTILLETLMFIFNHVFFHNRHHNFMIIIHDVLGRRPRRPFLWKHLWERRSQTHRGGGAGKSQGRNSITCIPILPPGDRTWFPFEQYLSLVGVLADHHHGNISGSEDKPIKVKSSRNA
jgi:hypothetical protein